MRGVLVGILAAVMVCLLPSSSFCQRSNPTAEKPVSLTYSVFLPPMHGLSIASGEWAKEIEKRTGGRVKITVYYGGTLTPADKCYDGVLQRISDIGHSCLAYTRGRFPLSGVIDLPLGYQNGVQASRVANAFYKKFQPKEFEGVKIMYLHAHGPGILHTKTPVRTLEDLKGKKIRCTGLAAKVVKALGGTPVAMPMGETYDALSRGIVDGSMAPIESLKSYKWGEVVKATTEDFGAAYTTAFFVAMNRSVWDSLPADIQKIIEQVNDEWVDRCGRAWDQGDREGREFVRQLGNQIISLSREEDARWAAAVRPLLDEYVASMREKGLPGEEALKFCLEQLKKEKGPTTNVTGSGRQQR